MPGWWLNRHLKRDYYPVLILIWLLQEAQLIMGLCVKVRGYVLKAVQPLLITSVLKVQCQLYPVWRPRLWLCVLLLSAWKKAPMRTYLMMNLV